MGETLDTKQYIVESLLKTKREGIEDLIAYMEDYGFFTAPCSTGYHLSCEFGLCYHTKNVMEIAEKIGVALYGGKKYNEIHDSVIISAALHDLGKIGWYDTPLYVENKLKSGETSKKPYKTNPDLVYIPHEVRSLVIAQMFIDLTDEEQQAILYHNGLYGELKGGINGKESPLYLILHFADLWATRVMEKKGEIK